MDLNKIFKLKELIKRKKKNIIDKPELPFIIETENNEKIKIKIPTYILVINL